MTPRPSMRRVLRDFRPYRRLLVPAVAAAVAAAAVGSFAPAIIGYAIDEGIVERNQRAFVVALLVFAAFTVMQVFSAWAERRLMGRFAHTYMANLRRRLLNHLFRLDIDFFTREHAGRVLSRLTADVENLEQFTSVGLALVLQAGTALTLTLALMFATSVPLALATLVVVPPLAIVTVWFQRRGFTAQIALRDRVSSLFARLNEYLVGVRVAQAFTIEEQQRVAFEEVNRDTYAAKMKTARVGAVYYGVVELLHPLALLAVIWVGGRLASAGAVEVGTVVAFTLYAGRLFQPIEQFIELSQLFQAASASFSKIFTFEDEQPKVVDQPGARPLRVSEGRIEIFHLSFRYAKDQPEAVHDVSFTVEPGERVAVVGGSGAGKSTVAKLIARLYDPDEGVVFVDGRDLRRVTASSLRKQIALVPQEGFLFDGTVADNIAVARPGATRRDVEEVAESLGLLDRLRALPEGLDTQVTNAGLSLSAGQRQLVALARALLAKPRIVLLDEATSSVDRATELVIDAALRRVLAGRTALVIAHRPATVLGADRVVVMENGRVAEVGAPAELAGRDGAFSRWLSAQESDRARAAHAS